MDKFGYKVGTVIVLLLSTIVSLTLIYWIMLLFKALWRVMS